MLVYEKTYNDPNICSWASKFFYGYLKNHNMSLEELCKAVGLGVSAQRRNIMNGVLNPKVLNEIKRRTGDDLSWLFPNNELVVNFE